MLELLRKLLGQDKSAFNELLPLLRLILHHPLLDEIVKASPNKADDLVLQILRLLIPPQ
jgi:hypothetical protein